MWQKQNPPHPCTLSSDLGEGVQGHQVPDFSVPQGSFCQNWVSFSLYRRKTRFKNTPLLWFSIKAHQRATGCGSEGRQRDGGWRRGGNERSKNKLFSVQEGGEGTEAITGTHSHRIRIRYINCCCPHPTRWRPVLYFLSYHNHPKPGPGCLGHLSISKRDGEQVSKQVKDAGFKDTEGPRKERVL